MANDMTAGHRPRFHSLGVGTPILLPILSVLGNKRTYAATDSTAPIKDAYSSVTIAMYVDRPAPLKLKAYLIVQEWLDGGIAWECFCPYCSAFLRKHPFRLRDAKNWWKSENRRALIASDLWPPSQLAEFMPLLAMPKDGSVRRAAGMARVGHNHWITRRIELALRRRSGAALRDYVDEVVEKDVAASSAPPWKAATRAAWDVTRRGSLALVGSGGEF